jgi:hypothetical protein
LREPTCAQISRAAGEVLTGTASRVAAWLLLQQQGLEVQRHQRLTPTLQPCDSSHLRAAAMVTIARRSVWPAPSAACHSVRIRAVQTARLPIGCFCLHLL